MKVSKCWIISENTACLITALNLPWKHISFFKCSLQSVVSQWKIREKERQEKVGWQVPAPLASFPAHSQHGHIVSLNKSNGWQCDKPASVVLRFTESARLCSFIPRSPHAAASRESQSCLLNCWMATVSLVFWLRVRKKNKTRRIDYSVRQFINQMQSIFTSFQFIKFYCD